MKKRKKKQRRPETAIVLAKSAPPALQMQSVIPKIEETIENLERVRRFVTKALNVDLQRELAKLEKRTDLNVKQRADEETALRRRLEIDWGTIPGVDKPFLMQPGAEKFLLWLNLRPRYTVREHEMANGHLEVIASVTMYSKKTGEEVFQGPDCSCSTMETNFRFVWQETVKPPDDVADTLKAQRMGRNRKAVKWVKGNRIEQWVWEQRVEKPNVHDERNKVRQIGQKRALVKGVRNLGALSQIFTADPSEWEIEPEDGGPEDEMDFTPGGRRIVTQEGSSPSGRYQEPQKPAKEVRGPAVSVEAVQRAQKIVERGQEAANAVGTGRGDPSILIDADAKKGAYEPDSPRTKEALSHNVRLSKPKEKPSGKIVLTWPTDQKGVVYVGGDFQKILEEVEKLTLCQWLPNKKMHAVIAQDAHLIADICAKRGYEYTETNEQVSGNSPAASQAAVPEPAVDPPRGGTPSHAAPIAGEIQKGTLREVEQTKTKNKEIPVLRCNIANHWFSCFDKKLWEFLLAGKGLEVEVYLDVKKVIVGIVRIGKRTFTEGHVPEITMNEERPRTTGELFQ